MRVSLPDAESEHCRGELECGWKSLVKLCDIFIRHGSEEKRDRHGGEMRSRERDRV